MKRKQYQKRFANVVPGQKAKSPNWNAGRPAEVVGKWKMYLIFMHLFNINFYLILPCIRSIYLSICINKKLFKKYFSKIQRKEALWDNFFLSIKRKIRNLKWRIKSHFIYDLFSCASMTFLFMFIWNLSKGSIIENLISWKFGCEIENESNSDWW